MINKELAKQSKILEIKVSGTIGIIDFILQEIPHNAIINESKEGCFYLEIYPFPEILLRTTINVKSFNEMNVLEYATFFKENKVNTLQEKLVFMEKFLQFNGKKRFKFSIEYKEDFLSDVICKKLDEAKIKHSAFEFNSSTAFTGTFFNRRKYIRQTLKFTLNNFFGANIDFIISLDKSTNDLLCKYEIENLLYYIKLFDDLNENSSFSNQSIQIENSFVAKFSITDFKITHSMAESSLYRKDFEDDVSYVNRIKKEIEYFVANYNFAMKDFKDTNEKIAFYLEQINKNKNILLKMNIEQLSDFEKEMIIQNYFEGINGVEKVSVAIFPPKRINLRIKKGKKEYSLYPMGYNLLRFIRRQECNFENDKDFVQGEIDEPISKFSEKRIEFVKIQADSLKKNKAKIDIESFYICTKSLPRKVIRQIIEKFGDTYKTPTYDQRFVAMKQFFTSNGYPLENLLIK